jgi:DNA polymerase III gamma/tau subunit
MELYKKHRPAKFKELLGQPHAVSMLTKMIKNNDVPHTLLFTGPSGTGKTTTARILKKYLKCHDNDFFEMDCADFRGIDMVRGIKSRVNQAPISGDCRIWLIDECFTKNTIIETPDGPKYIQDLKENDSIYSMMGKDRIVNTFVKEIALSRLIKVTFSNGTVLYCSDGHEFYTLRGWVHAKNLLKNDLTFSFNSDIMLKIQNQLEGQNNGKQKYKKMSRMWQNSGINKKNFLQQILCSKKQVSKDDKTLSCLWENNHNLHKTENKVQQNILQSALCRDRQNESSRITEKNIQCKSERKNKQKPCGIFKNTERETYCKRSQQKNDFIESRPGIQKEINKSCSQKKRTKMDWGTWWKWQIHRATTALAQKIKPNYGISYKNKESIPSFQKSSLLLQSRFSDSREKNSNRNRWENAQYKKNTSIRQEKNTNIECPRVESIEIFKRGCNEQNFSSVVGNKEINKGFIKLYDVEVAKHPSYFANKILVHNCQKLTSDAQDALLKILEDTPKHVYFMLATTDPVKLKKTIRTRSTEIAMKPLNLKNVTLLVKNIAEKEKIQQITDDIIYNIYEASEGSARKVLVILNKIKHAKNEDEALSIIEATESENDIIIIPKTLFNYKATWSDMAKALKSVSDYDPEAIRYLTLAYANKILLSNNRLKDKAYTVIIAFSDNFYETKHAGLSSACYEVFKI